MEDSSIYDDEVIPGSDEEENSIFPQISHQDDRSLLEDRIPAITQDTIQTPFDATMSKRSPISSITDETRGSSSRPKPRLINKRTDVSSSDTFPLEKTANPLYAPMDNDFSMAVDIAERAKMRSRNNKPQTQQPILPPNDIIELSSDDDDDDFNLLPPPKRRKVTNKAKSKSAKKSKPNSEHVVDTAISKPRPRPRPLKKPNQGANKEQNSPVASNTQDNPIPASSISNGTSSKLVPSQLPLSDPPSSTASSYGHPPITTLFPIYTDHDSSSPLSLFSSGKKNRGHAMLNVDELDSDPEPLDTNDTDIRLMPPPPFPGSPPTFFAGCSSPVHDDRFSATATISGTKTSAVKKSRKKNLDDVNESDGSLGTSKPKAKAKKKKTSAKKAEVVIEQLKAKSKGKEKEVFKSREFIDDDDDVGASDKVPATTITPSKNPESPTSVTESGIDASAPSKKRKFVDREDDDAIGRYTCSSEPKRRAVGTKGKRVIDSDDEDISVHSIEGPTSPKVKAKAKSQDKIAPAKKTSNSSLSADVELDDATNLKQRTGNEEDLRHSASSKENTRPSSDVPRTPQASVGPGVRPSLSSRYTIASKTKSTPMSDLIRRVNSKPGSPFCSPVPRNGGANLATPGTAYSPYVKASRAALSRIAPLHPNRRTPPPPPPPPPPKRKTKKELEREEQWEEELIESVGGITEWACMSDAERAEMRKAKREREMYGWED